MTLHSLLLHPFVLCTKDSSFHMYFHCKPLLALLLLFSYSSFILFAFSQNEETISALLTFRNSIEQDPSNSFSNWNITSNPNPCSWNGITCRYSQVISLSIPKANLYGSLSPSIFSLPSLRHINLRSNRLYGSLPFSISSSSALQSLVLYGNLLLGPIPFDIGKLSYLQILDLSDNLLNGSLPSSLILCNRLKTLNLSHNKLSNSLPVGFGSNLVHLEKLDLSYNMFNGSIPGDIGNLSNLQGTVDFSHNLFSGSIPSSLGYLPEKVYIDLSYNNLSGAIPQNGALENRGPTAFVGNPYLCGPPLRNPCSIASNPNTPSSNNTVVSSNNSNKGLRRSVIVAIVVSDVIGIALIALIFFCCYKRAISDEVPKHKRRFICFRNAESEEFSEIIEQNELVPLDKHVNFDLDELLKASAFVMGKSGAGIVYKVVLENGPVLAVRRLGEGGMQRFKEFVSEVKAIANVRHQNIVALRAYYWSIDEKLLIYDFIPNGNLSSALHGDGSSFQPLPWETRLKIMKGVAKGLCHLHEVSPKKYIHGNLKPSNILLDQKMQPYISDFGVNHLANIAASPLIQSSRTDAASSPIVDIALCYQAPEALKTLKASQKWDVYSYGVILLELISGKSPIILMETCEMDLVRWIQFCIEEKKPLYDVLDPFLSDELESREDEIIMVLKIALTCVQANPERRPTMKTISETLDRLATAR